jgi:hypothetical protein
MPKSKTPKPQNICVSCGTVNPDDPGPKCLACGEPHS